MTHSKIRRYAGTQEPIPQDGVKKQGDDEFDFLKDPPDLQPTLVYRELAALASDTAAADDEDLEFGPTLDVEAYRILAVMWVLRASSDVTETGILVPQVQFKQQVTSGAANPGESSTLLGLWSPPAVVDSTLNDGITEEYRYRNVYPASYRMGFESPGGEIIGSRGPDCVLQFDVTGYARFRLGVGVVTGSTGVQIGLLTSLMR